MTKPVASTLVKTPPSLALLRSHRQDIMELATHHGVSNIRVYGSVARGDATSDSDIDLLVDFTAKTSGLEVVAFAQELEDLLGYQVDIGTKIHRVIRDQVEREAVSL
ncbi:nucleotidyltransferase family protein [Ferrimicrobium sp.]|uniref:nucleotidyltransferase family protein n=1 Tax=Ferrimicrobium sp. TaxID=2926050 RepID=UPI00263533DD|nr:nucleotidyltransferase family protein [Ferrimicrobium sp.]